MKLVRHLAGYLPVNIASGIAAFGGVYVFTRLLGAEDYGRYALMVSALALIHTLSLTWVEAANYRFTARAIELGRGERAFPRHAIIDVPLTHNGAVTDLWLVGFRQG